MSSPAFLPELFSFGITIGLGKVARLASERLMHAGNGGGLCRHLLLDLLHIPVLFQLAREVVGGEGAVDTLCCFLGGLPGQALLQLFVSDDELPLRYPALSDAGVVLALRDGGTTTHPIGAGLGVVATVVLDVRVDDGGGVEDVFVLVDGFLRADDDPAIQISGAASGDLVAAVAGVDAGVLVGGGVIGVNFGLAGLGADRGAVAEGGAETGAFSPALGTGGVLRGGDDEVTGDGASDLFGADLGAVEGDVAAAQLFLRIGSDRAHSTNSKRTVIL